MNNKFVKVIIVLLVVILPLISSKANAGVIFTDNVWGLEMIDSSNTSARFKVDTDDNVTQRFLNFTTDDTDYKHLYTYEVKVTQDGKDIKYYIEFPGGGNLPLACDQTGMPYTSYSEGSTSCKVPLFSTGQAYSIKIPLEEIDKTKEVQVTITKYTGEPYVSTVASCMITAGIHGYAYQGMYTGALFNDRIISLGDLTEEQRKAIEEYENQIVANDDLKDEKGSWIEGILADIILGFGQLIQWLAEKAFGLDSKGNNSLTMDNLIFNRLNAVVIDLRDVFSNGVQIGPADHKGYFSSQYPIVVTGIQNIFSGLRGIAVTIYLIMLLYVGVKILLTIGTKDESKTFKFIQYWVTGIAILFFVPFFLSLIPTINNSLVEVLSDRAKVSTSYTISQIAETLGVDYMGEDAEVPAMKKELNKRIKATENALNGGSTELTEAEALELVHEIRDNHYKDSNVLQGCADAVKSEVNARYDEIGKYIYDNSGDWNDNCQKEYIKKLKSLRDLIYENQNAVQEKALDRFLSFARNSSTVWNDLNISVPSEYQSELEGYVNEMHNYLKTADNLNSDTGKIILRGWLGLGTDNFRIQLNNIENLLIESGRYTPAEAHQMREKWYKFIDGGAYYSNWYNNLYNISLKSRFDKYKTAVLQSELNVYNDMLNCLNNDPMVRLEELAKEQNRVVYAIAWCILLFQTFAVLFMYVKRIVVVMILICLFPLVIAAYVLDKMGDGKSQSLETWFKEFVANTTVQFFHAIIYILIVNLGIDAVRADPDRNWFILIIATCSLFPAERILRNIIGLRSSTLGQLKFSGAAMIGAGITAFSLARNGTRMATAEGRHLSTQFKNLKTNYKNNLVPLGGGPVSKSEALSKAIKQTHASNPNTIANRARARWDNINEQSDKKKARKQQYRDSRAQNRRDLQRRRAAIKANGGIHSLGDAVTSVRAGVSHVTGAASNVTGKIRNSRLVQGALKAGRVARFAGQELKVAGNMYKKVAGVAIGATQFVDATANGGLAAGFTAGIGTGRAVGGFKNQKPVKKKPKDSTKSPYNPQYKPTHSPGGNVSNSNATLGTGNTPIFRDEERDGPNSHAILGLDNTPLFTDEEHANQNNTTVDPAAVAGAAVAGAVVGEALDPTSGVQESGEPPTNQADGDSQEIPDTQPGEVSSDTQVSVNVDEAGNVSAEVVTENTASGDLSGVDVIDNTADANVTIGEDGNVSTSASSSTQLTDATGATYNDGLDIDTDSDE